MPGPISVAAVMNGPQGSLSADAYFLHWGVVQISLANFVIILLMVVLFVLALVVPFPGGRDDSDQGSHR